MVGAGIVGKMTRAASKNILHAGLETAQARSRCHRKKTRIFII